MPGFAANRPAGNGLVRKSESMGKFILLALATLVVLIAAGGGVLMFWHIPVPTTRIEHPIPDARLPH
ncbi:MAG: hypothetical protein KGJ66_08515 [Alphaproteobacteria bacterium]|nr:hypothetical protein [Alphaproteobacteria bacterium]